MKLKKWISAAVGATALLVGGQARAVDVGLELMLLIDVSGSVDTTEYNLQRQGYINAFNSATVQNAIINSVSGSIAVTFIEWSGNGEQAVKVGWTLINSVASATAFATAIQNSAGRAFTGNTAIQNAMQSQFGGFFTNNFDAPRQVIDVSGDGADNNTTSCNVNVVSACGRNAALAGGVDTINGLAILGENNLLAYYQNNVQSAGGFTEVANSFNDFGDAIQRKLIREISIPEPGSLALVALALLGAGLSRRKSA